MKYTWFLLLLLYLPALLSSCERSGTAVVGYVDTLRYDEAADTFKVPLPGEKKNFKIQEIKGFCLNRKYRPSLLQNIELISNQKEFEDIATRDCSDVLVPTHSDPNGISPYPFIDFTNTRVVAVIIDSEMQDREGLKDIDVTYRLDSCISEFNSMRIRFTLQIDAMRFKITNEKARPQLFLYHVKVDENLKNILVMNSNGMIGRNLTLENKN